MSKKMYTEGYIQNIANAIREKNGSADLYLVSEMADAILAIPTGDSGDITYERELVEEWDFTQSLTGSEGNTFTCNGDGAMFTLNSGIIFGSSGSPNVIIPAGDVLGNDGTNIDFEIDSTYTNETYAFNNSQNMLVSFSDASATGNGIEWLPNDGLYVQRYPRTKISPNVTQKGFCKRLCFSLSDSSTDVYGYNHYIGQVSNGYWQGDLVNTLASGYIRIGGTNSYAALRNVIVTGFRIYRKT